MTPDALKTLEFQIQAYMTRIADQAADPAPFKLKQAHTERVRGHIQRLSEALGLDSRSGVRAEAAALIHDLGRFPQYMRFNTFSDPLSTNHAALSAGVVCREKLLRFVARYDRQLILRAVALHNRRSLPQGLSPDLDCLARLLRDADKMDIFGVMVSLYKNGSGVRSFITHNLPDDGQIRKELVDRMMTGNGIPYSDVATLNDLKLSQLSMIYDLNFPGAAAHALAQGVVQKILRSMPQDLSDLEFCLLRYLEQMAGKQTGLSGPGQPCAGIA